MIDPLATLCRILHAAEQASARGAISLDLTDPGAGRPTGRVVAEHGRICWAVARAQRKHIGALLAEQAGCERTQLEAALVESHERGEPFGQTLIRLGIVTGEVLRSCLLRQTVAALVALSEQWSGDGKTQVTTAGLPAHGYDPEYTTPTVELLDRCISFDAQLAESRALAPECFAVLAGKLTSALLFRDASGPLGPVVPVAWGGTAGSLPLGDVLSIGREALTVIRPVALAAAEVHPYAVLVHGGGEGIVCGRSGAYIGVYGVGDRFEQSKVMARLKTDHDART